MGLSTRNPSLGRGLACTPQVSMHVAGWWCLGGWDPQAGASDRAAVLQAPLAPVSLNRPWTKAPGQASPAPWCSSVLCE